MPSITVSAEGQQERIPLDAAIVTLGRGLESDVRLKDIKSSRRHCQIVKMTDGYKVVDLGSGNGTFLNGVQIKEQRLKPGDKIQIGQTVITFEDGSANGAGATTQTRRGETRALQRPTTAGAAKTGTGRAATSTGLGKTATNPVGKPSTSRLATQKTTGSGRRTTPANIAKVGTGTQLSRATTGKITTSATRRTTSASARYTAEMSNKKKINPLVIVCGGAGGLILLFVALMIFASGSGEDPNYVKQEVNKFLAAGQTAEDAGDFERAEQEYRKALEKVEGKEAHKTRAAEIRSRIEALKADKIAVDEANKAWQGFKEEYEKQSFEAKRARDLMETAIDLKRRYGGSDLPWVKDLKVMIEKLQKIIDTDVHITQMENWQYVRNDLQKRCKLEDPENAMYGQAIRAWREYLPKAQGSDVKQKVEGQIENLNKLANGRLHKAKNRAELLDPAEAKALLQRVLSQVEGAECEAEAREALNKL